MTNNIETIFAMEDKLGQYPLKHLCKKKIWHIIYHPLESTSDLPVGSPWTVCKVRFDKHGIRIKTEKGDEYVGDLSGLVQKIKELIEVRIHD